jgi:hypothetical protein
VKASRKVSLEEGNVTAAMAENLGMTVDKANDRGWFDAAKTAVDNQIDLALENLANFDGIVEGLLRSRGNQRAAHDGLPERH